MKPDSVYIDPEGRFAIGYFAQVPKELGLYSYLKANDWEGVKRGMKVRAVFSLEDFNEKISIFDCGLDDVTIEHMKFFITHIVDKNIMDYYPDFRFVKRIRMPEWIDEVDNGLLVFNCPMPGEQQIANLRLSMGWYYDHLNACEFDLRMKFEGDFIAHVVDRERITYLLSKDPGIALPYYRLYSVHDTEYNISAVTIRKTATTPTLRLFGVQHKSGITLFPPQFTEIRPLDETHFLAFANGNPFIISSHGGLYDSFQRHLPPVPIIDQEDYLSRVAKWIFSDLKFYYRDTFKDIPDLESYQPGCFIRAGFFCDVTQKLEKPADGVKVRFLIMSSHAVPLFEIPEIAIDNIELTLWELNIFHYNDFFRVMDVFTFNGVTQVTLLQVPPSSIILMNDDNGLDYLDLLEKLFKDVKGQSLIGTARQNLFDSFEKEVNPLSLNRDWQERTQELIGIYPDGTNIELEPMGVPPTLDIEQFNELINNYRDKNNDVVPKFQLDPRNFDSDPDNL